MMKISRNGRMAFLLGFAQAFDFSGVIGSEMFGNELNCAIQSTDSLLARLDKNKPLTDMESLAGDWRNIGGDFQRALSCQE